MVFKAQDEDEVPEIGLIKLFHVKSFIIKWSHMQVAS
jgi:hypothetical protein